MSGRAVTPKAILESSQHISFITKHGLYQAYSLVALMAGSNREFRDFLEGFVPDNCRIPVDRSGSPIWEALRLWRLVLLGGSDSQVRRYDSDPKRQSAQIVITEAFAGLTLGPWYADSLAKGRQNAAVKVASGSLTHHSIIRHEDDPQPGRDCWLTAVTGGEVPLRLRIARDQMYLLAKETDAPALRHHPDVGNLAVNLEIRADALTLHRFESLRNWMPDHPLGQFSQRGLGVDAVVRIPAAPFDQFLTEHKLRFGSLSVLMVSEAATDTFLETLLIELRKVIPVDQIVDITTAI